MIFRLLRKTGQTEALLSALSVLEIEKIVQSRGETVNNKKRELFKQTSMVVDDGSGDSESGRDTDQRREKSILMFGNKKGNLKRRV